MIIESTIENGLWLVRIKGRLTLRQFESIQVPPKDVERFRGQRLNVLVLLDGFEGWVEDEGWGEMHYMETNDAILHKIAVVGEPRWREPCEMFLLKGLRPFEIEYFLPDEIERAIDWLAVD